VHRLPAFARCALETNGDGDACILQQQHADVWNDMLRSKIAKVKLYARTARYEITQWW
jgi:hypothetical protein